MKPWKPWTRFCVKPPSGSQPDHLRLRPKKVLESIGHYYYTMAWVSVVHCRLRTALEELNEWICWPFFLLIWLTNSPATRWRCVNAKEVARIESCQLPLEKMVARTVLSWKGKRLAFCLAQFWLQVAAQDFLWCEGSCCHSTERLKRFIKTKLASSINCSKDFNRE